MTQTNETPTPRRAPSVAIAFRTLRRTLRHGYDNLGTLALASLMWYAGTALLVTTGVVTAALHRVTKPMSEERASSWRGFWPQLRADSGWGSVLTGLLLLGFILFPANIQFYQQSPNQILRLLVFPFIVILLLWFCVALYAFPIALRQEQTHPLRALRNAIVMTMANLPGALVSITLLGLLCTLLLVLPPLFLLIPGVVALWGQENARLLLVEAGYVAADPIADKPRGQE